MSRYAIQLRIRRDLYYGSLLGPASSVEEALGSALADVAVGVARPAAQGGEHLDLLLRRPTHQQAVEEAIHALQQVGYSLLEAEVSQIVNRTVEGAVLGFLGGGTLGLPSKNPYVELAAATLGALAGGKAGSMVESVVARYHYSWFPAAGWVVTPMPVDALAAPATDALRDLLVTR